jgi:hypothetical protein
MKEWVKYECGSGGDKSDSDFIGSHAANQFTNHVNALILCWASGVKIVYDTLKLFQPSAQTSHSLPKQQWFNLAIVNAGKTPQEVWDAVNKYATEANNTIPGTAVEEHVKIYSQDIITRFIGICTAKFLDERSNMYIHRIMEGEAKGILTDMESYRVRSTHEESKRLGAASSAVIIWTHRFIGSDVAVLWTAAPEPVAVAVAKAAGRTCSRRSPRTRPPPDPPSPVIPPSSSVLTPFYGAATTNGRNCPQSCTNTRL